MPVKISFLALILFSLSSCFEVVEDVTFNNDGSGMFKLIINLSQSKSEINTLMNLDSSSGYKVPKKNELNLYLDQSLKTLKATEGLSNVTIKRDYENWIFELKTDFKNTENLETGLKNIYKYFSNGKPFNFKNKLIFDGKTLERDIEKIDENTRNQLNKPTEKIILAKAKYTTIYRFEKTIEKSNNHRAKISPSKKAIMLQSNVLNIINGKETIKNYIKLNEP